MGDRAQVAIKDSTSKIYLYGHWIGAEIYPAVARALERGPERAQDAEYLSRIIFNQMQGDDVDGTTGYGIGTVAHEDIEHLIPVLDCDTQTVSWEMPKWEHNKRPAPPDGMPFTEFASKALAGEFNEL